VRRNKSYIVAMQLSTQKNAAPVRMLRLLSKSGLFLFPENPFF
jgi:hypothetical protein